MRCLMLRKMNKTEHLYENQPFGAEAAGNAQAEEAEDRAVKQ